MSEVAMTLMSKILSRLLSAAHVAVTEAMRRHNERLEDEVISLRNLAQVWQPVSKAPKDRQVILACFDGNKLIWAADSYSMPTDLGAATHFREIGLPAD